MKRYHTVLSIAGSDSIGGAGIQADIKTCTALGAYAMTAISAVTAQNTLGVTAVEAMSRSMLEAQISAVCSDIMPDAVKTGMLPTVEAVEAVCEAITNFNLHNVVVDPVMVATSGDELTNNSAVKSLQTKLLPLASIVTPNIPEAEILTGMAISSRPDMRRAANNILRTSGPGAVLIKGGHMQYSTLMADLLVTAGGETVWIEHRLVETCNTHGTGCTLSSAIASYLAHGLEMREAVQCAVLWLTKAIQAGADYDAGHGHGAVNHLYQIIDGNRD